CARSSSTRTGRRNAAGGRSAAAQRERKHPVEIMEEFCQRSGLESPIYSALPVDIVDCATGGKIQLFAGQAIISSLRLRFLTPGYYNTAEEAKVGAAETAVYSLHYSQLQLAMADCPHMIGFASDDEVQSSGHSTQSQLSKSRRTKRHKDEVKHHHSLSPVVRGCHRDEASTQKRSLKCHLTDANRDQSGDDDDQYVCGGLESLDNGGIMPTTSGEEVTPHFWCHTVNGTLPPTTATGGMIPSASTTSLLPMVFPQALSNRSLPFPPLQCQSGLYAPSPGPLTPMLPLSTYDSGLPLQNLPIQNQLLDFQPPLISNSLLPCGGIIAPGTLVVDPTTMNTPTSSTATATFGGLQSCPTTNGEALADFKQKSLVNQNNGHCSSAPVSFLPSLIPIISGTFVDRKSRKQTVLILWHYRKDATASKTPSPAPA
ncbi:hypothetical protein TSMEX_008272, partial [Taenia solium]